MQLCRKYFPYQGTNGNDIGPGFLLQSQSPAFQKKARTVGLTKKDYDEFDDCYHSLSECFNNDDDMNLCLQNYAEELYEDAFDAIFEKVVAYTYVIDVSAVYENRRDISAEYVKERVNLFMPIIKRFIKDVMAGVR